MIIDVHNFSFPLNFFPKPQMDENFWIRRYFESLKFRAGAYHDAAERRGKTAAVMNDDE